jgi:hypothetical protein
MGRGKMETKNSKKEFVDIRVLLEGDHARKFTAIKNHKGIAQNTEVIRSIVTDFFNEHEDKLRKSMVATIECKGA